MTRENFDALYHGLGWMLQQRKVSVKTMQRLLSSDHRVFDDYRVQMRKEAMSDEQTKGVQKEADDNFQKLEALRTAYADLSRKHRDAENRAFELKDLPTVADAMFRFLAGVDFRDHSLKEQKEFREHMSKLKTELKRAGIGSWD